MRALDWVVVRARLVGPTDLEDPTGSVRTPFPSAATQEVSPSKRGQDLLAEVPFHDELSVAVRRCQG